MLLVTSKAPSPYFLAEPQVACDICLEARLGPRRPCFTVSTSGGAKLTREEREGGGGGYFLRVNLVSFPDPQYGMQGMYGTESLGMRQELRNSSSFWELKD